MAAPAISMCSFSATAAVTKQGSARKWYLLHWPNGCVGICPSIIAAASRTPPRRPATSPTGSRGSAAAMSASSASTPTASCRAIPCSSWRLPCRNARAQVLSRPCRGSSVDGRCSSACSNSRRGFMGRRCLRASRAGSATRATTGGTTRSSVRPPSQPLPGFRNCRAVRHSVATSKATTSSRPRCCSGPAGKCTWRRLWKGPTKARLRDWSSLSCATGAGRRATCSISASSRCQA